MASGFALRGLKGWAWTIDQYREEIPAAADLGLTFLMNCYISLCDIDRWGILGSNRWWEPFPDPLRRGLEVVVHETRAAGLDFWFAMNPNLFAERHASVDEPAGLEALWAHYDWMQGLGVRWFCLALDDVGQGTDAHGQAGLVNELVRRLRVADPGVEMTFCPTVFWGAGSEPDHTAYLGVLARRLDPAVRVFWTGDSVIPPRITPVAAEAYRAAVGHRLVIWDNYPCNDDAPTMHLGPLVGRDPGLPEVADGYMTNPMRSQNRLGRLPLATAAEYARDPAHYDPSVASARSIRRLARTPVERAILAELAELYPGSIAVGGNQYVNPVRERIAAASARDAATLITALAGVVDRFRDHLGARFPAELRSLEADLEWSRQRDV